MDGYPISEVARLTGFSPSTLRYYDHHGLVRPARTDAGYRVYDDGHIERLGFIARAKQRGLALDEIDELLGLLDHGRCAPVRERLRAIVDDRIADARARLGVLAGLIADLETVSASLEAAAGEGPCGDTCGCDLPERAPIAATPQGGVTVACNLASEAVLPRVEEWRTALASAVGSTTLTGGVRFHFERDVEVASLARLADAEAACCSFLTFSISVSGAAVHLDITGPLEAAPVIETLTGRSG